MKPRKESILHFWYQALSTPYGVEIQCIPDIETIRGQLYQCRAEVKDDDLKKVALCVSPFDPGNLWLVRKEANDEAP